MHVCLSCIEFFGFGIHGGFGRATRFIGRELARRGVRVTVLVPRRGSIPEGNIDGMEVRAYDIFDPASALKAFRDCGADVFHSQDPSTGTALARHAAPAARHVVTFRDTLDSSDWRVETALSGKNRLGFFAYRLFLDNPWVTRTVRRADALACAARFLIPKAIRKYGLEAEPEFLPTPVDLPKAICKSSRPTVAFVGRWDVRKRPERFFELARAFPKVDFIAVGGSADPVRNAQLHATASALPNVSLPGIIDQFRSDELSRILSRSWILVNTSAREGLPTTFLEAAAHGCALLSHTDRDGFASTFGRCVGEDGLAAGLASLLETDWRDRGLAARDFVGRHFGTDVAMQAHLSLYQRVLAEAAAWK
jgi:glycosyltransferase involved in cell wall biosynthesis